MSFRLSETEVVVTGMGLVTPLGNELDTLWQSLLAGETAVRHWDDLADEGFRIPLMARVTSIEGEDADRGSRMAVVAAQHALANAALEPEGITGVFAGTTMGESIAFEQAATGGTNDLSKATAKVFPQRIHDELGLTGPVRAYATACAAGNYAIGAAAQAIAAGQIDYALAGGVEPISRIALAGFSRSRAMSSDLCRPFDRQRSGMQLGEAAAFLLLERKQSALARGASPLSRVISLGLSCDAYHPTAPSPDGEGMARAMNNALEQADLLPADIDWICAHGSGTRASDAAEAKAIQQVFGETSPPVSAIKGALGHSMGAATAVEAIVAVLALQNKCLPPTVNLQEVDPEFFLDIFNVPRETDDLKLALNCGYGFGGLNSALVLEVL